MGMDIDWSLVFDHLTHLMVAYLLALPLGWDRERAARGAGLRTFPLVAMASCGFALIGISVLEGSTAHARILYGLMTGIGFIGGGAILKSEGNVRGTTTAAAIWTTGAIGAAVAWQRYEIALVLSLLTFATLRLVAPIKALAHPSDKE
ncbi:MgtC/SapB transporter [Salinisphaera sp. PC39]|uniref:MgtC/SapB family protein n=1 Tax=Salinisphaera sp. PC39 TaxID=1304156 RepID=UPI003340006F